MRYARRDVAAIHAPKIKDHRVIGVSNRIGSTTVDWSLKRDGPISKSAFPLERTVEFLDRTSPILYRLN